MKSKVDTFSTQLEPSEITYPDPEWSSTYVNYFKDAEHPPPDSLNSSLSEHEIRQARRSDDSPHIARTPVHIRNIRGFEAEFSLEKQGFKISHLKSSMQNWRNNDEFKQVYLPEIAELLKNELGATHVFSYEYHIRTGTLEEALKMDSQGKVDIDGPVRRVHIDESPASGRNEFNYHMQPSINDHLKGRQFGIYNVWKPLKTIRKDPLCLCDTRTLRDEDLQSGKVTVPKVGEIENFAIRPPTDKDRHAFVYLREQQPSEVYLFRIFDTRLDGGLDGSDVVEDGKRSHGVAHTSFIDPGTECQAPRESVEVRSFCIF